MNNINVEKLQFTDSLAVAEAAASALSGLFSEHHSQSLFALALSGGRIAQTFFPALAGSLSSAASIRNLHLFWADERCVPPGDPESNFLVADSLLIRPLGLPSAQVHRIQGELQPAAAAAFASSDLCKTLRTDPGRIPVFDLVILGMGEDGHIASLFPGASSELLTDSGPYRPVLSHSKPPPQRITLTYPVLSASRRVWVLVTGAAKREAVQRSLSPQGDTPLAALLRSRQETRIFSDFPV